MVEYENTLGRKMKKTIQSAILILKQNKAAALTAFLLIILEDVFFSSIQSDLFIFGMLAFYIFLIHTFKLKSKPTFFLCLFILGFFFVEVIFTGTSKHVEKAAVWLFLFMAIGVIQELLDKR